MAALRLIIPVSLQTRNKPCGFGVVLVGVAAVVVGGGIPKISDTFTLNSPSFPSTIAFLILEMVSSSATLVLNFKRTLKIRPSQLRKIVGKIEVK